jgi:hypothetical protein
MRRWPWITMTFAALLALCPIVQDIAVAAYRQSPTDWLRELWLTVTVAGVVILALLALLERWIRSAGRPRVDTAA